MMVSNGGSFCSTMDEYNDHFHVSFVSVLGFLTIRKTRIDQPDRYSDCSKVHHSLSHNDIDLATICWDATMNDYLEDLQTCVFYFSLKWLKRNLILYSNLFESSSNGCYS